MSDPPLEGREPADPGQAVSTALVRIIQVLDFGVVLSDDQQVVRYCNDALRRLVPPALLPIEGRHREDLLAGWDRIFQPAAMARLRTIGPADLPSTAILIESLLSTDAGCWWQAYRWDGWLAEVFRSVPPIAEADRQTIEFFALAAHDLKTPVTSIKGYAQLSARQVGAADQRVQRNLQAVVDQADRLVRLIDGLVDVGRLRWGRLEIRPQPADLAAILRTALASLGTSAQTERVVLRVDPDPLPVVLDAPRLRRVIEGLSEIALKQTPVDTTVRIEARLIEDQIVIELLAGRFPTPTAGETPAADPDLQPGGFGLPLARQIVESHGGTFEFHYQPGDAVRVLLRLPFVSPPE